MLKKFTVPRGTSDILPESIPSWESLESKTRAICRLYGYREMRMPIFEDVNLFKRSLGQTSDVVNKQLLELVSNSVDEGYALRPEGTAAVARAYIENNLEGKESLSKLFYIGPMFRGERPQKGRLRQFHQIGVEAIGPQSTSPYLDAEMMALSMHLLSVFGVKGPRLKINSLGSKEDKAHTAVWLRETLGAHKTALCQDCQARFERNVFRVLDCKKEDCRKITAMFARELPLSLESQAYFHQVQANLKALNIPFDVAPHLVRGLDYYTHTVFEITAEGLGSQDAVGAGGRYDALMHALGAHDKINYGAMGFALGMERILLARDPESSLPWAIPVFVIAMESQYQPQAFALMQRLRQASIGVDMSFSGGSIKSQMGKANKANARFALILGEDEINHDAVALKDMRTGQQERVPMAMIVDSLVGKLERLI